MATAKTDDGIELQWTSSSVPVEQLDAALNRGIYELIEADEQDVFQHAPASLKEKAERAAAQKAAWARKKAAAAHHVRCRISRMKRILIYLLLLGVSTLGMTQDTTVNLYESGNDFLRLCENPTTSFISGACQDYVLGVVDGIQVGIRVEHNYVGTPKTAEPFCLDSKATLGQEVQVLIKFIKTHPEKAHFATSVLVLGAMADAFPCVKAEPTPASHK